MSKDQRGSKEVGRRNTLPRDNSSTTLRGLKKRRRPNHAATVKLSLVEIALTALATFGATFLVGESLSPPIVGGDITRCTMMRNHHIDTSVIIQRESKRSHTKTRIVLPQLTVTLRLEYAE